MKPVVVIGAGIGGLSTAIHLAIAGLPVVVYEKNAEIGGKMSRLQEAGFYWDRGPSVITMQPVFEALFAAAGREMADYLTLLPVEPLTRYFYPDGTVLDASRNREKMAAQIRAIEPRDEAGYRAYLDYVERIHRITGPVFIYDRPPTWRSFLRVPFPDWFRVDGLRTMDQAIRAHVRSPQMRQLLGRFATYVGASPYRAPATLNVIAHVELNEGVWYPKGGVYQIAKAFRRLATELGVRIHTGCGVARINVADGRTTGVTLESGETVAAEAVVSNLDVTNTYRYLLPAVRYAEPQEVSCSGFIMLLGVDREHPQLAHHNIFFSSDYAREFEQIFARSVPPDDPTVYVSISAKSDPEHAPPGSENWFVLVNAPATNGGYDWEPNRRQYASLVLERLAAHGYDIRPYIRVQRIVTPLDLARETGAWRGALYGASSNQRLAAFKRPHNRSAGVAGLYFAGGTTHPGGGVPMVTLSGKVAAGLLLEDLAG